MNGLVVFGMGLIACGLLMAAFSRASMAYRRRRDSRLWRIFGLEPKDGYFKALLVAYWAVAIGFFVLGLLLVFGSLQSPP